LSEKEQTVIMTALNKDITEKKVNADGEYTTAMQAYMLYLMVEKLGASAFKYATSIPPGMPVGEAADLLRAHHDKATETMQAQTRTIVVTALKVFWTKWKLCTDNMLNENFWMPPEAD
jgi:hypothetical protein